MVLADRMNEEHEAKQAELERTVEMLRSELRNEIARSGWGRRTGV